MSLRSTFQLVDHPLSAVDGIPGPGKPGPVVVAVVLGPHGVAGELRAKAFSDFPQRFDPGQRLYLQGLPREVMASSFQPPNLVILKLSGLETAAEVRAYQGQEITVPTASAPKLPPGEFYHYQLLNLRVVTEEGEKLGRVTEIIETGSNDVYLVRGDSGEVLLPALSRVIRAVDLEAGTMTVRLMDGLR